MSIKKSSLYLYIECLLLLRILRTDGIGKYLFLIAVSAFLLLFQARKYARGLWFLCVPPILCSLYGTALSLFNGTQFETLKETGFICVPAVITLIYFCDEKLKNAEQLNFAMFCAIVTSFLYRGLHRFTAADMMESTDAFILGAYTVYFFCKKRYKLTVFTFACTFLAHKRIALAAVVIGIFLYRIFAIVPPPPA